MFHRSLSLGSGAQFFAASVWKLFDQLFAFNLSLRKNSHASPWKLLVPDLIVALTIPPSKFPNSAEALLVIRLNSSMASGAGVYPSRLSETWLLSIPSSRKLLDCSRLPLIRGRPPLAVLSPLLKLLGSVVTAPGASNVNST